MSKDFDRCGKTSEPDATATCYACSLPNGHTGMHGLITDDLKGALVWEDGQIAHFEPGPMWPSET